LNNSNNFLNKIKSLIKKFTGSGSTGTVFKNMGILASGSFVSKLIGFGSYPIITRIYSPDDFGILAVFTSAIFIIYPFGTLRYSVTIPLPKSDGIAMNIMTLGLLLILLVVIIVSLIFSIAGNEIFTFFNAPEISNYWVLLVIGVIGASLFDLLTHWATRIKSFGIVAKAHIWQTTISVTTQITLGLLGLKPAGLLYGEVARKWGGIITQYRYFYSDFQKNIKYVTKSRILFLFKYYRDLPLFHLPSQLLLVLAAKTPLLYFAFQFGTETAGQLGLSLMVVGIPMGLIGKTAANAYYAEIAKIGIKQKKQILNLTLSLAKRLLALGFFPTLVLLFFSPFLFQIIFGADWLQAGEFTSILAIYLLFEFMAIPLLKIFNVFDMQRKFLEISVVRMTLITIVFSLAFILSFNVYVTLVLYMLFMVMHFIFASFQVYKVIK